MNTNNNCPNCRKWIVLFSIACAVVAIQTIALTVLITQRVSAPSAANPSIGQTTANSVPSETPSELLLKYAGAGEVSLLEELLKRNPSMDINRPRSEGNKTALYLACEKGYTDIAKLLLDRKADTSICDAVPGSLDAMKYSPLTVASRNGHCEIVKALLVSGVKIESRDNSNRTALWTAAINNQPSVVKLLCEKHADVNNLGRNKMTPLKAAIFEDNMEVVKIILKLGRGINLEEPNQRNQTLLCKAVEDNNPELVRLLCEAKAKVNVYGDGGYTPLTLAAYKGYTEVLRNLLKYGEEVDIEMRDRGCQKSTPLYHAALKGHADAVEVLCKAGANLNTSGGPSGRYTPLTTATEDKYDDVVKILQEYREKRQKQKQVEESSRSKLDTLLK